MSNPVIVGGARTPIGKMQGALAGFSAADLGGFAIKGALARAGIAPEVVDYVIMGQVLTGGAGQNPARQASVNAGIPMTTPAVGINKVCLSGTDAVAHAAQLVRLGEAEVIIAGGQESMTNAPYVLPDARAGYRLGDGTIIDSMMFDGLTCALDKKSMGLATDEYNSRYPFGRQEQDDWAARSHELAANAQKTGVFDDEIVAVEVPQRKGDPVVVDSDEGVRPGTTAETLSRLRPAFTKEGTITAGNASQISDGGCALIVTSDERARSEGWTVLGEIVAHGFVAGEDPSLHSMPARAIQQALGKAGLGVGDVDLFEANEAFAAVTLAALIDLELDPDVMNVNGGAIAMGHPIGASGARIVLHALLEQRRRGGGLIAAGICGGGGQGEALLVRSF